MEDIKEHLKNPVTVLGIGFSSGLMAALSIVAVLVILYYLYKWWSGESFMPTQTMRMQQMDNMLIGNSEHQSAAAASGAVSPSAPAPPSFFQSAVQSQTQGTMNYDPNAPAGSPGSLSYQVLNSPDFACATRTPVTDNAWSWMTAVAEGSDGSSEGMRGGVKTDNQLSALLAGH